MLIPKGLYALDLGTTKYCLGSLHQSVSIASHNQPAPSIEIIGVPALGMRRGMVADFQHAKQALNTLLDAAERHFNDDVSRVLVGIAGSHLESRLVKVSVELPHGSVRDKDIEELAHKAEHDFARTAREILHCVPIAYHIDSRPRIENPVGCSGRLLLGDFFIIDADKAYLADVVKLCNECGLEVARLVSEPFASASVTVSENAKELGMVLADIGGGTTDGLVFQNGRPCAAFTVNIAGTLMTNDLAIGLNLPLEEAERVKVCFGLGSADGTTVLEATDTRGKRVTITAAQVYPILAPRIRELTVLIARNLSAFKGRLGAGIQLTGGGSEVLGIAPFMESLLKVPVTKARPTLDLAKLSVQQIENSGFAQSRNSALAPQIQRVPTVYAAKYATVVGLLNLEVGRQAEIARTKRPSWPGKYLAGFMNWLKELS